MTLLARRWPLVGLVLAVVAVGSPADAQYFGRNKVQYERFDFRIMKTDHLEHYFYPAESLATADMARAGERWYSRLSDIFRHQFDRKSVVWYADHPDFQQTNVIGGEIEEGTGGVTEGLRTRVVMPHTGSYWDTHHVLGHELVHVFQYNIAESGPGGLNRLSVLPLWLVEGMAEYLSLGRNDPLTAMWLRDAALRDKLPTIKQLTTDPRFFPYRYGQALWAYVAGRYGDRAVVDVYRASLRVGWDQALIRVLGVNQDSLSKDWIASIKSTYMPLLADRTKPQDAGDPVLKQRKGGGDYNLAPTVSPDGKYVAFFSRRGLFTIDLYVADAATGRIVKKLVGPTSDSHFDAISFISSSGDWSPDARKFAFIAFAQGNHEVAVLDVRSGKIERRIKLPGIGAVNNVAWSPDGRTLALSGMHGGISDLFLLDLASGQMRALTNDRNADIHPAWSPDGRTIAFATDRGPRTNFQALSFAPVQLATIDVASGQITLLAPFGNAKQINPQYAPDGQSLFFVSDQDGFSDIYRLTLATNQVARVTRVATGVSGITHTSPAITVARGNGRLLFSVFDEQGWGVYGLDASRTVGEPVTPAAVATGGILPPGDTPGRAIVSTYLADAQTGLSPANDTEITGYRPSFSLDAIGQPSIGVSAGGPFGTGVAGGVSFLFGDQLGDQQIFSVVQANGTVQDIGGQVVYLNSKRRLNWGVGAEHTPYLTGYLGFADRPDGTIQWDTYLERIFVDQGSLFAQYPFSNTRRLEFGASATRLGFSTQIDRIITDPSGQIILGRVLKDTVAREPLYYSQGTLAYVADNSFSAFTGPVAGRRYRLEVSPTVGTVTMNTLLADYRKYFFARPITFAFRGLHYGRYGKDAENLQLLSPLYLGEETIMRGYGWGSIDASECPAGTGQINCPVIARLLGSRLATASAELRIPFFGTPEFGLINFPYLPLEVAPFFDAGVMWTGDQRPRFSSASSDAVVVNCNPNTPCAVRTPVYSTGVSFRMNVLGYMIFEAYVAHPFQRPQKNWVWGFQLAPGW